MSRIDRRGDTASGQEGIRRGGIAVRAARHHRGSFRGHRTAADRSSARLFHEGHETVQRIDQPEALSRRWRTPWLAASSEMTGTSESHRAKA